MSIKHRSHLNTANINIVSQSVSPSFSHSLSKFFLQKLETQHARNRIYDKCE